MFPSDKTKFNLEFFNETNQEREELKDVLGLILAKIINKNF